MPTIPPFAHLSPPVQQTVSEVRYSLPELLREVAIERSSGSFAMEKIDQVEIAKLFANKKRRRDKPTP